jgi:RNA polymerase sigma-70 factor (ECF subfamily)
MKTMSTAVTEWITWLQAAARLDAPTEGSDDDLICRGKKGDRDAFARLVHRYQDRAFTLARRLTGDAAAAEDLAQEAFLQVYRNLARFEEGRPFLPWFTTIIRNLARNRARKAIPMPVAPETLDPVDAGTPGPPERAAASERKRQVEAEVAALPDKYRDVVALRYLEDRSVKEVAGLVGIPEGTVKTYLFRARDILRRRLGRWLGKEAP